MAVSEKDFKSFQDTISSSLVNTTRTAGQIAVEDLAFHRSSDPSIAQQIERQNARLLALVRSLTRSAVIGTDVQAPGLPNAEAVEDNWQGIVDVVDNLLEKTDSCLDECTGLIKRLSPAQRGTPVPVAARKLYPAKELRDPDIPKPQLFFRKVPDNQEVTAFKPLLRTKPHAVVPLEESVSPLLSEDEFQQYDTQFYLSMSTSLVELKNLIDTHFRYRHPYETEITQSSYPSSAYEKSDPIPPLPLESTTATFVDSLEGVEAMLAELKTAKEIAIDLEHHDKHSYVGIVSLMQISTREKDWVVDTLKPWREELQILNEVFADPNIIKVFHGAYMDIIWLQRDLGLYVVGLFDTFHASRALGYPQHSLASLLTKFVNFDAQKKFQMADWRIRPLPTDMFNYARSDTHFLLFIYDQMRNELIDKSNKSEDEGNLIDVVLEKSKEEALRKYERSFYDAEHGLGSNGWYNMITRTPAIFTRQQFAVFRAVHRWRDSIARKHDENVNMMMQKGAIYRIATEMPVEVPKLLSCSHPVSAFLREHIEELVGVISQAKATGTTGPDLKDILRENYMDQRPTSKLEGTSQTAASQPPPVLSLSPITVSVRSDRSAFWGPTLDNQQPLPTHVLGTVLPDLRLAVPLPPLTAEVFSSTDNASTEVPQAPLLEPGSRAEHKYVKERKPVDDEVFIIKEVAGGRKRTRIATEDYSEPVPIQISGLPPVMSAPNESNDNVMELESTGTQLTRQERKALKKAKKAQAAQERETNVNAAEEPFDYNKAASVLHAKLSQKERASQKKPFDPYSKSLNAPKGMRKLDKEIAGKSYTFKS